MHKQEKSVRLWVTNFDGSLHRPNDTSEYIQSLTRIRGEIHPNTIQRAYEVRRVWRRNEWGEKIARRRDLKRWRRWIGKGQTDWPCNEGKMETTGKPCVVYVELKLIWLFWNLHFLEIRSWHNINIPAAKFAPLHQQFDSSLEWPLHSVGHTAMEKWLVNDH